VGGLPNVLLSLPGVHGVERGTRATVLHDDDTNVEMFELREP
jgi:hypothetical protein